MKSQQQRIEQSLRSALAATAYDDLQAAPSPRSAHRRETLDPSAPPADKSDRLRELVSDVAAAYFSNSHVSPSEIPTVVAQIAQSLSAVVADIGAVANAPAHDRPTTAQVKASIKPDGLHSFEDGKIYKSLRRHLANRGLTPETYREKWGLPMDYPMVAASLSAKRSNMARANGLGRKKA